MDQSVTFGKGSIESPGIKFLHFNFFLFFSFLLVLIFMAIENTVFCRYTFSRIRHPNPTKIPKFA